MREGVDVDEIRFGREKFPIELEFFSSFLFWKKIISGRGRIF